jgi:hypothetical protein
VHANTIRSFYEIGTEALIAEKQIAVNNEDGSIFEAQRRPEGKQFISRLMFRKWNNGS